MKSATNKRQGGFLLAKVHQLSSRIFARMLKDAGIEELNPAQGRILFALWQGDHIPIRELASRTQLEKSTLSSMLDRLEEAGFIERIADPEDRRRTLIARTEKDRALQAGYDKVSARMSTAFYGDMPETEVNAFENSLQKILENLVNTE